MKRKLADSRLHGRVAASPTKALVTTPVSMRPMDFPSAILRPRWSGQAFSASGIPANLGVRKPSPDRRPQRPVPDSLPSDEVPEAWMQELGIDSLLGPLRCTHDDRLVVLQLLSIGTLKVLKNVIKHTKKWMYNSNFHFMNGSFHYRRGCSIQ